MRFLSGSPWAAATLASLSAQSQAPAGAGTVELRDALNVFEFEELARKKIPPAHFGYLASGVDDDLTLMENRRGFARWQLRPRRLVDVSQADLSTKILGEQWDSPLFLCPVGSQRAFHPEGEMAVARAAQAKNTLQVLSTVSSTPVEEVMRNAWKPIWYQLYPTSRWDITERLVRRAEAAGCPVLVATVDLPSGRNSDTQRRMARTDTRVCSSCHGTGPGGFRRPMFEGIETTGATIYSATFTWKSIEQLRKMTKMKIVLKGIVSAEDADLSCERGIDAVVVSNHGGRAEETGRSTIETLPEVVDAVRNRIPVLVDGGFRRGTDIFKALALGAKGVGVGRPYIWGLGAFGQPGVERVIDVLRAELLLVMRQCGATSIGQISRSYIAQARIP